MPVCYFKLYMEAFVDLLDPQGRDNKDNLRLVENASTKDVEMQGATEMEVCRSTSAIAQCRR